MREGSGGWKGWYNRSDNGMAPNPNLVIVGRHSNRMQLKALKRVLTKRFCDGGCPSLLVVDITRSTNVI